MEARHGVAAIVGLRLQVSEKSNGRSAGSLRTTHTLATVFGHRVFGLKLRNHA
jgi:hypothetical protein